MGLGTMKSPKAKRLVMSSLLFACADYGRTRVVRQRDGSKYGFLG